MDRGLWAWSRHPNYFFQWFGWLAWPVMALDPAYAFGWAALVAPVFMWWLLNHVSGVPMLEAQMLKTRPEAYRAYQARVSRFLPLPPRRG
jgi:steroid 5-alpha reductase family enzyme